MSCACGKSTFGTRGKAEAARDGIRRHGEKREKTPSRAYPCPSGHGWHLTSQEADDRDAYAIRKAKIERRKQRR